MEIIAPSETFRLPLNDRNALDQSAAAETQAVCFQATDLPSLWSAHQWSLSIPSVPQITNCTHFFSASYSHPSLPILPKRLWTSPHCLPFMTSWAQSPQPSRLALQRGLLVSPWAFLLCTVPGCKPTSQLTWILSLRNLLHTLVALTQRKQWKSPWGGGLSEGTEVCSGT